MTSLALVCTALILAICADLWPRNAGLLSGVQQLCLLVLGGWAITLVWGAAGWLRC